MHTRTRTQAHVHTTCSTLLGISKPTMNNLHRFHLQNLLHGMIIEAKNAHAFGLTQKNKNQ